MVGLCLIPLFLPVKRQGKEHHPLHSYLVFRYKERVGALYCFNICTEHPILPVSQSVFSFPFHCLDCQTLRCSSENRQRRSLRFKNTHKLTTLELISRLLIKNLCKEGRSQVISGSIRTVSISLSNVNTDFLCKLTNCLLEL